MLWNCVFLVIVIADITLLLLLLLLEEEEGEGEENTGDSHLLLLGVFPLCRLLVDPQEKVEDDKDSDLLPCTEMQDVHVVIADLEYRYFILSLEGYFRDREVMRGEERIRGTTNTTTDKT